jgi:hypothetical protein
MVWANTTYTLYTRVVQFVFWEQGFDKVRESSRTLELFEGFDVQFWKTGPWAPHATFKSSQIIVYVYNLRGGKGAGMAPCHHCRSEKGEPSGAVQMPRWEIS